MEERYRTHAVALEQLDSQAPQLLRLFIHYGRALPPHAAAALFHSVLMSFTALMSFFFIMKTPVFASQSFP
jgi:hypothetical protein